jgi:hypothetical protein
MLPPQAVRDWGQEAASVIRRPETFFEPPGIFFETRPKILAIIRQLPMKAWQ